MFQTTNQIGLEPQLLPVDHSSLAAELLIIWLLPASARHHNAWHAFSPWQETPNQTLIKL
jgi:hypothetical protein